jgi:hypothetical protein
MLHEDSIARITATRVASMSLGLAPRGSETEAGESMAIGSRGVFLTKRGSHDDWLQEQCVERWPRGTETVRYVTPSAAARRRIPRKEQAIVTGPRRDHLATFKTKLHCRHRGRSDHRDVGQALRRKYEKGGALIGAPQRSFVFVRTSQVISSPGVFDATCRA